MTVEAFDAPGALRRLIADGGITEDALQAITGIGQDESRSFVNKGHSETALTTTDQAFSIEQSTRLSVLAAQLTDGMTIPDDERLKAILESLTTKLRLTPENLAQLMGLDAADVGKALIDPKSIPVEQRYRIAVRTSYLVKAFNRAAGD